MASRAVLIRKRNFFDSVRGSTCLIRGSSQVCDLGDLSFTTFRSYGDSESTKYRSLSSLDKEGVSNFSARGFLRHINFAGPTLNSGITRSGLRLSLGARTVAESIRCFSTSGTNKPETDTSGDKNTVVRKKEASPEECDEAVEGLTTVKAKAKKLQESKKTTISVFSKIWALFFAIGPALKVVASMSRK